MPGQQANGLVIKHRKIRDEYFEMEFIAPAVAEVAQPGQFLHLRVGDGRDPLLRRPLSIADIDRQQGTITLLYRVVGRGTEILSRMPVEAQVDIMGPLGRGFTIGDHLKSVLLIGGGIGVAPLFFLARRLAERQVYVHALLGAANTHHLLGRNRLRQLGVVVSCATEDGSYGTPGLVTELIPAALAARRYDFYYACGPNPMLKAVQSLGEEYGLPGELSLEAHMACGVGACLGCTHLVRRDDGTGYARVCVEGPVFPAGEVVFND